MHPRFSKFLLTTAALIALTARPAAAGPEGGTVVGGAATIQGQGGPAVVVNQSSNSAIINWHTFNIGARESVRFNQPGSSSVLGDSRHAHRERPRISHQPGRNPVRSLVGRQHGGIPGHHA